MTFRTGFYRQFFVLLTVVLSISLVVKAGNGIILYTPYTNISVPPGETVEYTIDVKNNGSGLKNVEVYVSALPGDWSSSLKAGGYSINQVSVLPGETKTLSLKVNKGNHRFRVIARNFDVLPLVINVSEQGTFKTEFTSDQANMEGHSKSNFTFTTKLKNQTGEKQMYSLRANAPRGWTVIFKPNFKQATAVEIEANSTTNISIEIKPPTNIGAGTYKIPVQAVNNSTSAGLDLEVVITGSYDMELTTPSGLLSTNITAGKEKRIEMVLKNTGSGELRSIAFRSSTPKNWDVEFKPDTISYIEAGGSTRAFATIKAYDKAIPGDYVTKITARSPDATSTVSFRVSVKTPLLWGWLGILIIAVTLVSIYYLFRRYGRR